MVGAEDGVSFFQGFLVAQQGQALAGDDADDSTLPADTPASEWPVARLAGQLRCTLEELANGFEGGPRIELSVMEPTVMTRSIPTTPILTVMLFRMDMAAAIAATMTP